MLVLRELHHVSWQVAELEVGEAVVPEVFQETAAPGWHDVRAAVARPRGRKQLAAGVEQTGCPTGAAVLGLCSRGCRDVAPTAICQATYDYRMGKIMTGHCGGGR